MKNFLTSLGPLHNSVKELFKYKIKVVCKHLEIVQLGMLCSLSLCQTKAFTRDFPLTSEYAQVYNSIVTFEVDLWPAFFAHRSISLLFNEVKLVAQVFTVCFQFFVKHKTNLGLPVLMSYCSYVQKDHPKVDLCKSSSEIAELLEEDNLWEDHDPHWDLNPR